MARPTNLISTQPWRAGVGKPYMSPKKIMSMPHPNYGVQDVSKAAQMGRSVVPKPPPTTGPLNRSDIIFVPQKQIDLSLQRYFSAKARLLRQMEFTKALLERSYNSTLMANRVNAGRELRERALQIKNEVRGLSGQRALQLAQDQSEQRAVGRAINTGRARNDINALINRTVPRHQGQTVTEDDPYLPSGGMAGGKGQALAELRSQQAESGAGRLSEDMRDRMGHFEKASTNQDIAANASVIKKYLNDILDGAADRAQLDEQMEQSGLGEEAENYAEEGMKSGADPDLTRQRQQQMMKDRIIAEASFIPEENRNESNPEWRRLQFEYMNMSSPGEFTLQERLASISPEAVYGSYKPSEALSSIYELD